MRERGGGTAIEISPVGPHGQAPGPNRNLARLRFLEIGSRITIKSGRKPFRLKFNGSGERGAGGRERGKKRAENVKKNR